MMLRPFLVCAICLILSSCGMSHTTGMHAGGVTAPTPDIRATPVATVKHISISDPWARTTMQGDNSASYLVINNSGDTDRLIGVRGDIATSIELHTVENADGVMKMQPVEGGISVPAHGTQLLQPGGFHIMLIGVSRDLKAGDRFALTLTFATVGDVSVTVTVR